MPLLFVGFSLGIIGDFLYIFELCVMLFFILKVLLSLTTLTDAIKDDSSYHIENLDMMEK